MASTVLMNQVEPDWGEHQKVYTRKIDPFNSSNSQITPPETNMSNPSISESAATPNQKPDKPQSQSLYQPQDLPQAQEKSSRPRPEEPTSSRSSPGLSHVNPQREIPDSPLPGYITFNLAAYSRKEIRDLRHRLRLELGNIRSLIDKIDSLEASASGPPSRSRLSSPDVEVVENNPAPYFVNPNSVNSRKRPAPYPSIPTRDPKRVYTAPPRKMLPSVNKRCMQILAKLMKHKHGWIFNTPVDVVGLQLHDYHQIIHNPMDLGTVKVKLTNNGGYTSPLDFAADVRLTFHNALKYNPKGHDVYLIAEQLLKIFEQMFEPAHKKFMNEQKADEMRRADEARRRQKQIEYDELRRQQKERERMAEREQFLEEQRREELSFRQSPSLEFVQRRYPTPVSSQGMNRNTAKVEQITKPMNLVMSIDEKENLGKTLQELPEEQMFEVLQIIRKGNITTLAQHGDEVEVDFEVLGNDTLWELHRLVRDYNLMVKRRQSVQVESDKSPSSEMTEAVVEPTDSRIKKKGNLGVGDEDDVDIGDDDDAPGNNFPPVEIEKDIAGGGNSSSSSSGGGSDSSSDSDSGSSSDEEIQSPSKPAPPPHPTSKIIELPISLSRRCKFYASVLIPCLKFLIIIQTHKSPNQ